MTASHYARALFELIEKSPRKGAEYLHNLDGVLKKRGHQKLLPRIFSEFQKIQTAQERSAKYQETTPEQERTRVLLELYRKLTKTA